MLDLPIPASGLRQIGSTAAFGASALREELHVSNSQLYGHLLLTCQKTILVNWVKKILSSHFSTPS